MRTPWTFFAFDDTHTVSIDTVQLPPYVEFIFTRQTFVFA